MSVQWPMPIYTHVCTLTSGVEPSKVYIQMHAKHNPCAYMVMAYIGMAYVVMAYIVMAYIIMAYIVMAHRHLLLVW